MPLAEIVGVRIHFRLDGPPGFPVVMLSNSLGTNLSMWEPQVEALCAHYRILRYDTRGHGQTDTPPGPYTIEQLAEDAVALLDYLEIENVTFCGLSMGGMIAMLLGRTSPGRLDGLVLANTSAKIGSPESWDARIALVNENGMEAITSQVIERWFTPDFRLASPDTVNRSERMLRQNNPLGYVACCAAIRDTDQRKGLEEIKVPTLVISGARDAVTPPLEGETLASRIPGATHVVLDAAHLSNLEQSQHFNEAALSFLKDVYA
jgi:3-oxoadipate enol-lactonase